MTEKKDNINDRHTIGNENLYRLCHDVSKQSLPDVRTAKTGHRRILYAMSEWPYPTNPTENRPIVGDVLVSTIPMGIPLFMMQW